MIRQALPAGKLAEREQAFVLLFQQRFRRHEPGKAIGIRFMKDGRLRLLTPARLEPWHIDRIAMMLYRETQQDFNKTYDIDIYETFIGTPPIKIAELRRSPQTPARVTVVYHYPVGNRLMLHRPTPSPWDPPAGVSQFTTPPAPKTM